MRTRTPRSISRRMQRMTAIGLISTGAITGLWAGVSFFRVQAQGNDPNLPADVAPPAVDPSIPPADPASAQQLQAQPPVQTPPAAGAPPGVPTTSPNAPDLAAPPEEMPNEMQGGPQDIPPPDGGVVRTTTDGFIYNPEGLRDPFFPARGIQPQRPTEPQLSGPTNEKPPELDYDPKDPLQAFELREYRLVAVLWDVREPKAMVSTPDGKVWTIRQKVRLGRAGAVVAAIRESEIVIVEPNPDGSYVNASTRVMSIKR